MDIRALLDRKTTEYDAYAELSSYGFSDVGRALANLRLIADGVDNPLLLGILPALLNACRYSADPDVCLNNFERVSAASESREGFLEALSWHPESVKLLAPLFSSSKFLTTFITGDPEGILGRLLAPGVLDGPKDRDRMFAECLAACPPDTPLEEAMDLLRRFKYEELLRITVRDLLGRAGLAEVTLELSNLADAAIEAAVGVGTAMLDRRYGMPRHTPDGGREGRCPFTVIAMGKLGGRELNYSSDVDVMFLYLTDQGETAGPEVVVNHQYFVKLGELITRIIGEKTSEGFVFRVDTRLRPEGERGDLAQCLSGYEIYYESWGQTWERSALVKARPCAGEMGLGRAFLEMVRPFVYRKYLDFSSIAEIRDMKQRVEKAGVMHGGSEINVKLGAGGIREIEFFISALQLIYGGREPGVQEKSTLKALHKLALKGLISFEEQKDLTRAYEFLRTAEHRIQVVEERQAHSVAGSGPELRALAQRMGFRDSASARSEDVFLREYARHTGRVRAIYDGLFAVQGAEERAREEGFELLLAQDAGEDEAAKVLVREGFQRPGQAYRNITLLRDGSFGSPVTPRSRSLFVKIMPLLLSGCAASPDPDMALNNLESFITSYGTRETMYALIKDRPEIAGLITKLFGSSEYFSRLLVSYPELSDMLLLPGESGMEKAAAEVSAELGRLVAQEESFGGKMDVLRRFKHAEEVRIGIKDVFLDPGYKAVSSDLSALAEGVISAALEMSLGDLEARYGLPEGLKRGRGIAVAGFGKLGGRELSYGSDLDIIFIYGKAGRTAGPDGVGSGEFFARLSERVIFALSSLTREGSAFRVDTRLRPGGSKGVLAHTLDSLGKYYNRHASVWELQALTRARAVAGDPALCEGFQRLKEQVLTQPRDAGGLADEVRKMRARMERELGGRKKGVMDIKYGRGGIVDVEFVSQYLQLAHGPADPGLLVPETAAALDALVAAGKLSKEDGETLKESYGFLRELESKLRITTTQAESVLPEDGRRIAVLAARMGYSSRGEGAARELVADFKRHAEKVRTVFDKILRPL